MNNGKTGKKCHFCEAELMKDEIALNKKIVGRSVVKLQCLICLAAYFETTEDDLREKIEFFKMQGCTLFGA